MLLLLLPLSAFLFCAALHAAALSVFPKLGLLDFPERYGLRRTRIPYPTGTIAIVAFLIFFVAIIPTINIQFFMLHSQFFILNSQNTGIIASILLLGLVSFIDDRTTLPSSLRLAIQIIVALIIFATGSRIYTITNPLEFLSGIPYIKLDSINIHLPYLLPSTPYPLFAGLFTIVWLCLAMNALNWLDGIPGQVSSLSTVGFTVIGLLALSSRVNQPPIALLAFTLAGITLACLLFDFPPPRVLMGDTGAMFFGLMLGILTIYAGGKVATAFLAFGVPFTDCLIVMARRVLHGRSPFRGSSSGEHLHHRLLAQGWSPQSIIALTVLLGTLFGIGALFLGTTGKFLAALFLFGIILSLSWFARPSPF